LEDALILNHTFIGVVDGSWISERGPRTCKLGEGHLQNLARLTTEVTHCPITIRLLPNRPQPLGSQAQLQTLLKSGSYAPFRERPVGMEVAAGGRSRQPH
jgi:hypothetical protein